MKSNDPRSEHALADRPREATCGHLRGSWRLTSRGSPCGFALRHLGDAIGSVDAIRYRVNTNSALPAPTAVRLMALQVQSAPIQNP